MNIKRIAIFSIIILLILIIGMFFIRDVNSQEDTQHNRMKVGLILNGDRYDHTWGESHYDGLLISAKILNLDIVYRENVPEDGTGENTIEDLINEGCKIIICDSFGYGDIVENAAQKYPQIYFFHAAGTESASNICSYFGRIYQMRYLSGIVAGMRTETNEIGYVAAYPIPEVIRGINAFALGVHSVNPNAVIRVSYCNSWTSDDMAQQTTEKLLADANIDVITMHLDSLKVLEIAEAKGIYSIGYNMDNSSRYPNTFLTAPVWRWESFYTPHIKECMQNRFTGKNYWDGIETGIIDLAPLTDNVADQTAEAVEKAREELENGNFDVFYGPIRDNQGNIRIGQGECMTDENMLNDFTWYVEGVEVDE